MEGLWSPGHFHHHWSAMDACSSWESSYHTCHRPTADPWLNNVNFTLPRGTDRHRYEELMHDLDLFKMEYPPLRVIRSFTDLDMTDNIVSPWSWWCHLVMLICLRLTCHERDRMKRFSISFAKIITCASEDNVDRAMNAFRFNININTAWLWCYHLKRREATDIFLVITFFLCMTCVNRFLKHICTNHYIYIVSISHSL